MKDVVTMKFGSHLYGTSTPASDSDFKAIYIPSARDILLQRVKAVEATRRPKEHGERNRSDDVDTERFALQRYLGLLAEGQTLAVDMLFAPAGMILSRSFYWDEIVRNKDRLLTKRASAFVGYCRSQAAKYGVRGSRVAAARAAMDHLQLVGLGRTVSWQYEKLATIRPGIEALVAKTEHMSIITIHGSNGPADHWEVCDRKLPFDASIGNAQNIVSAVFNEYGRRARMAERNEGIDWKALSHAVRVGEEAIELMSTGGVTFPRPEAAELIAIKLGEKPYAEIAARIEDLLDRVEAAVLSSPLRAEPDLQWIDDFVADVHAKEIIYGG